VCGAKLRGALLPLHSRRCAVCATPPLTNPPGFPRADTNRRSARLRERVRADLLVDRPLQEVERWIAEVEGLDEDERSALWLYAWVCAEP